MCGITGIFAFNLVGKFNKINISSATASMRKRGPDYEDIYIDEWVALGHRRLSVIDTSENAHQPMWDESRRYAIVYNGEIFNYRQLRKELEADGSVFRTASDTEVLLHLFIRDKERCLEKLNGFFAFCVYDKREQTFFLARDRYGVKPLLYVHDEDKFLFASEMKTILEYGIEKRLDHASLLAYLQLNYIPAPDTIFRGVKKLLPGHYMILSRREISIRPWYHLRSERETHADSLSYEDAKRRFASLLESAVQERLVADVPLGAFLSGGIDSSVVTGLARRHKPDLQTFSIGFRDEKFFDETRYANLVAKHFDTRHTVFSLTNRDLFSHLEAILDYLDEPFADSSAINVFILSRETRRHATVALSGDGADELLGGYHKHEALNRMLHPGWKERALAALAPVWRRLPKSRNGMLANFIRQADRFSTGARLTPHERYWHWACLATEQAALKLLNPERRAQSDQDLFAGRKEEYLRCLQTHHTINDILLTDVNLVLANDMLVKTDSMSMANGLEIRSPFLDHRLVDFIFSLPGAYKIRGPHRKRILRDAFREMLPPQLYHRPKKGFEVPLLKWMRNDMRALITEDLLSRERIEDERIFDYTEVELLKKKLFSRDPGDAHARVWALVVFQWWFKKYGGG